MGISGDSVGIVLWVGANTPSAIQGDAANTGSPLIRLGEEWVKRLGWGGRSIATKATICAKRFNDAT